MSKLLGRIHRKLPAVGQGSVVLDERPAHVIEQEVRVELTASDRLNEKTKAKLDELHDLVMREQKLRQHRARFSMSYTLLRRHN